MPLRKAKSQSRADINRAVAANIRELHKGYRYQANVKKYGKARADKIAEAAAESAARGR